jgi:hypothetical protein
MEVVELSFFVIFGNLDLSSKTIPMGWDEARLAVDNLVQDYR